MISPEIIQQALASVDTVVEANKALQQTTADLDDALSETAGGSFIDETRVFRNLRKLRVARVQAGADFILAESMVPNLRDERLISHPDFTLTSSSEQAELVTDHSELKYEARREARRKRDENEKNYMRAYGDGRIN